MSAQLQVTGEAKIRDIQGPVVANSGVITALDGAASQYVRGDGTLADFPTSSGGGSSVSYYLNSSVSQGTIGGVAYRELSKDPIIGAGTDIAISTNGYVANYITDVNDPDVVLVPGGNFNCEFYFSVNNNTGNPTTYAELYKYDGTTFTLLGTSAGVPESINQGTTIAPYYFAIPVATAALSVTDRLAIRIYVNVDGRTVTLHTENGHLCQVVTTLSKGMVSLNNLTDQSQYLATGTSGTNFAIVSTGDTHTFNLPVASATNTGKLSSTDWSTFNGKVPYTGAIANVDLGTYSLTAGGVYSHNIVATKDGIASGGLAIEQGTGSGVPATGISLISSSGNFFELKTTTGIANTKLANIDLASLTNNTTRTFTLPDLSGTLALLEGSQTFSGAKTFTENPIINGTGTNSAYTILQSAGTNKWRIGNNYAAGVNTFDIFSYDNSSSPLSINSNGAMTLSANVTTTGAQFVQNGFYLSNANAGARAFYTLMYGRDNGISFALRNGTGGAGFIFQSANGYDYTFPAATGTLALTSNLSAYLPLTGGTLTGALSGTSATFSGNLGLGVTVNTNWTDYKVMQIGEQGVISSYATGAGVLNIGANFYWNGGYKYLTTAAASLYQQNDGAHNWRVATSGTAGNAITWNTALTIASTGAATFSSSVTTPSITNGGQFKMDYGANAASRSWRLISDSYNFGDFSIQQSTTQSGSTYADRLLISASGNVGIGTSSPSYALHTQATSANVAYFNRTTTDGDVLTLAVGGTNAFIFNTTSGVRNIQAPGAVDMAMWTNSTERMRITTDARVLIGKTTINIDAADGFRFDENGAMFASISSGNETYYVRDITNSVYRFYVTSGGTINATNTTISAISDVRLKENITDLEIGLDAIMALRPRKFDWKKESGNDGKNVRGFIAQEFEQVFPDLIDESLNKSPEGEAYKQIRQDLIPILVKAIQEQQAQIEELKAMIAAK